MVCRVYCRHQRGLRHLTSIPCLPTQCIGDGQRRSHRSFEVANECFRRVNLKRRSIYPRRYIIANRVWHFCHPATHLPPAITPAGEDTEIQPRSRIGHQCRGRVLDQLSATTPALSSSETKKMSSTPFLPSTLPLLPLAPPQVLFPYLQVIVPLQSTHLALVLNSIAQNAKTHKIEDAGGLLAVVPVIEIERRVGRWACGEYDYDVCPDDR